MKTNGQVGPWVRRFLLEHLVGDRNFSPATQASYRDTLALLLPWAARVRRKEVDSLSVEDLTPDVVRGFLVHVEKERGCGVATRNQRLAALHAFARFVGGNSPEHLEWSAAIRSVPFKRGLRRTPVFLEKPEMDAVLAAPDPRISLGRRDRALLLFLYNSGARAQEAARLTAGDLDLGTAPTARVLGKGGKPRLCPLWSSTADALSPLVHGRAASDRVFLNRRGGSLTRFGVRGVVRRAVAKAVVQVPTLRGKRVSPHTIRHTTATHLLCAGVDINTIREWLGHVSLETTNIYTEVGIEMKARALAQCRVGKAGRNGRRPWRRDRSLMEFLRALRGEERLPVM